MVRSRASDTRGVPDRHTKDTWTVFKIMGEFVEGFETLRQVWPSVSIFGSARATRRSRYYQDAVRVASALSSQSLNLGARSSPPVTSRSFSVGNSANIDPGT